MDETLEFIARVAKDLGGAVLASALTGALVTHWLQKKLEDHRSAVGSDANKLLEQYKAELRKGLDESAIQLQASLKTESERLLETHRASLKAQIDPAIAKSNVTYAQRLAALVEFLEKLHKAMFDLNPVQILLIMTDQETSRQTVVDVRLSLLDLSRSYTRFLLYGAGYSQEMYRVAALAYNSVNQVGNRLLIEITRIALAEWTSEGKFPSGAAKGFVDFSSHFQQEAKDFSKTFRTLIDAAAHSIHHETTLPFETNDAADTLNSVAGLVELIAELKNAKTRG